MLLFYCERCDATAKSLDDLIHVGDSYLETPFLFLCQQCFDTKLCAHCNSVSPVKIEKRDEHLCCPSCDSLLNEPLPLNFC